MKKDQLENWFSNHRQAFDDKTPPEHAWSNISKSMGWSAEKRKFSYSNFMWKAAAIIFFGISCYLYGKSEMQALQISSDNEFQKIEAYYMDEIEDKTQLLIDFNGRDVFPNPETEMELQRMDAMYQIIKEEYSSKPSQKLKEALMLNLLIRDNMLNEEIETFSL